MQIKVARADGYLRVELTGREGPEDMHTAITRMLDECQRNELPTVLIVTRQSRPLFKLEDFSLSFFLDRMTPACRVAMVAENPDLRASDEYIAAAARLKKLAVETFADEATGVRWLRSGAATPSSPRRYQFSRIVIAGAPNEWGVYTLWKGDEVVYYGRAAGSESIRTRLLAHYQRNVDATHYSWEMCRDPVTREAELLKEFEASFGRAPKLNDVA